MGRFDLFQHRRIRASLLPELTDVSSLGSCVSLCGVLVCTILFLLELAAFLPAYPRTEVVLTPHSSEPLRVSLNISFPRIACQLISVEVRNVLGSVRNVSGALTKFALDGGSGRTLWAVADALVGEQPPQVDAEGGDFHGDISAEVVPIEDAEMMTALINKSELTLVAFGAPWCPWSRRLAPVLVEVAAVLGDVADRVRIGKVDCTEPAAAPLCQANQIAAYPTIILFLKGEQNSLVHYHGERDAASLLSFLAAAQQDTGLTMGGEEGHIHGEALQRRLGLVEGPPITPEEAKADHTHENGHDPADPGTALCVRGG